MKQTVTPRWLTRKSATAYSGIPKTSLDIYIREKRFATRKVGRIRLIDRESLDTWIESQPVGDEPAPTPATPDVKGIASQIAWHAEEVRRLSRIL